MQSNDQIVCPSKTFSRAFFRSFMASLVVASLIAYLYLETILYIDFCSFIQKSPCNPLQKIEYQFKRIDPKTFLFIYSLILAFGWAGIYPFYSAILKRRWRISQPPYPLYILAALSFWFLLTLLTSAFYIHQEISIFASLFLQGWKFFTLFSIIIASVHYALLQRTLKKHNISQADIADELNTQHNLEETKKKADLTKWHLRLIFVGCALIASIIISFIFISYACATSSAFCDIAINFLPYHALSLAVGGMLITIFISAPIYWFLIRKSEVSTLRRYTLFALSAILSVAAFFLSFAFLLVLSRPNVNKWLLIAASIPVSALHLYFLYYYDKKWGLPKISGASKAAE